MNHNPVAARPVPARRYHRPTEHVAHLGPAEHFDTLYRKDDLLEEGVHTVFGIKDGEAELLALCFPSARFTPEAAWRWLREWRFRPVGFAEGLDAGEVWNPGGAGHPAL